MSGFFQQVEGEAAVLVSSGVYRQTDIYMRDGYIYAKWAGGFVRLMADGSTTKDKVRLDFMSWTGTLARDRMGRLCTPNVDGCKTLGRSEVTRLLGAA